MANEEIEVTSGLFDDNVHHENGNDDDRYNNLSKDEISNKLRLFRNLCLENKINTNNAFDIDMIGYFQSWLEKQKLSKDTNVKTFQEIADYLEASAKVYGFRVDHLSENTNRLVEGFKSLKMSKLKENVEEQNEDELLRNPKSKALRLMLTTADKLSGRLSNMDCIVNPAIKYNFFNFSFKKLFEFGRPVNHISSLFNDTTINDELNINDIKKEDDEEIITFQIPYISDKFWSEAVLCPKFSNFLADKDQLLEANNPENIENLIDHFDPSNLSFPTSISHEVVNDSEDVKFSSFSIKKEDGIGGLLTCVDYVRRDYSFFNPNLLVQWNGPRAWKTQAMAKALKSKKIAQTLMLDPNLGSNSDTDDDNMLQKHKPNKLRNKDGEKQIKIEWLSKKQLKLRLQNMFKSKEIMSPRTILNWNPFTSLSEPKSVSAEKIYKFTFLEYLEIVPEWLDVSKKEENLNKEINSPLPTQNHVDIDYSDETNTQVLEALNDDINHVEHNENDNLPDPNLDESEDNFNLQDFKRETTIDIADLKKKMFDIINTECIKIESDNEWSSRLLFSTLLQKITEDRQDLSVGVAYVSLLHLVNERGLKLFQDGEIINGRKDIYIARPLA